MNETNAQTRPTRFRAPLKRALLLGSALALGSSSLLAQTPATTATNVALVTFFSNPIHMLGGLPGQTSASFKGKLFADHDQLATMTAARFVTISFVPGSYEFTATTVLAHSPVGGGHLMLDLAAHHHYFIELRDRESAPFTKMFGIKEVACEEAFTNNAKDRPLNPKALAPAGKDNLIAEASFPTCPETN